MISFGHHEILGCDNLFVVNSTKKTYQEHKMNRLKISSRDMVLSQFLQHKIYYKTPKTLKHFDKSSLKSERVIDFGLDIADIINYNPLNNTKEVKKLGLKNMLHQV